MLWTINPKLSIPVEENFHVGLGSSLLFLLFSDGTEIAGALYGVGTYGNTNNNGSVGLGFGYDGSGLVEDPLLMLSGQIRASKAVSIISEIWILPYSEPTLPLFSFGLRLNGEKFSLDFAYLGVGDSFDRAHLPFLSFMIPFGKNKKS